MRCASEACRFSFFSLSSLAPGFTGLSTSVNVAGCYQGIPCGHFGVESIGSLMYSEDEKSCPGKQVFAYGCTG
jgi:hypothetical protein